MRIDNRIAESIATDRRAAGFNPGGVSNTLATSTAQRSTAQAEACGSLRSILTHSWHFVERDISVTTFYIGMLELATKY